MANNCLLARLIKTEQLEHPIVIQVLARVAAPASVKTSVQKQLLLSKTEYFLYVIQ